MRALWLIGLLLSSLACTARPPVRQVGTAVAADLAEFKRDPSSLAAYEKVQGASTELHDEYVLSFVELDSRGKPARSEQARQAEETIRQVDGNALVVLFVHGWGHSADARDSHVDGFRHALSRLKRSLNDRTVVGIYVGWPARWLNGPLHYLTFLDRSRAAQGISRTGEVDVLLRSFRRAVEDKRREGVDIVSVAVGHSLGGKFLFTPMEVKLESKKEEELCSFPLQDLALFGDLVLLLNPAQDVHDYEVFTKYAGCPRGDTRLVVATLSSEGDGVVRNAFRFGRTVRNIFTPRNWPNFQSESIGLGWEPSQVTHTLCSASPGDRGSVCDPTARPASANVKSYGSTELWRSDQPQGPFIVARVDRRLVGKHSDIFNDTFLEFLRGFVAENVGNVAASAPVSATLP